MILIIYFYQHSRIEQPTSKNKPLTERKTWDQSTPLKKRGQQYQLASYSAAESGRDTQSYQQHDSTLAASRRLFSAAPTAPDVTKALTSSGRRENLSASG